jgi:hypothetical protein
MAAGGGVPGKGNGTVRITMIQAGATIAGVRLFIEVYPRIGGITTGRIVGKEINGTTKQYPTSKFSRTGEDGRRIIIGRNKITRVSRVQEMIEGDRDNNMNNMNSRVAMNNGATMKEEEIRKYNFLMKY